MYGASTVLQVKRLGAAMTENDQKLPETPVTAPTGVKGYAKDKPAHVLEQAPGEVGGTAGPEPTRYGDWSHKGIVSDF
jgi:hypothetical protein